MHLSIAIPDSCLKDEKTLLDKSRKISTIARAAAIFKIETIFIYDDAATPQDKALLPMILKYLNTPPFLRKRLYPKVNELKYAGVLHPLQIPNHTVQANPKNIKDNDIREGITLTYKGKKFIDIGINQLLAYYGKKEPGKRLSIKFKKGFPNLDYKEIPPQDIPYYWGYSVKEKSKLLPLLHHTPNSPHSWNGKIILTSRRAKTPKPSTITEYQKSKEPILVVFGTVDKGLYQILGKAKNIQNAKFLNFFPNQATQTVRLEEAILGTLSILNFVEQI
jgi:predicted SPOUT superfamily RNA methylase MTH1